MSERELINIPEASQAVWGMPPDIYFFFYGIDEEPRSYGEFHRDGKRDCWHVPVAFAHNAEERRNFKSPLTYAESVQQPEPAGRKVVQVSNERNTLVALCDDGTMWVLESPSWDKLPPIPQP